MRSKRQSFFLLLTLLVIPFMLTGCGKNNNAKDVAVEMVTRLSKDNYKNIGDIFYQEENSYFDEEAFKELIQDKGLNISGNKTINVKEVGEEITDSKTNYTKVTVEIGIDNNKVFNVDTIKVGNKWYVYEPDFYDGNIEIVVPSGTTVKFNGKKLDKSYKTTKEVDTKVYYPNTYRGVELDDVKMDTYTIKNVISGEYSVSVKGSDTKEVKDVVYTYSQTGKTSDNYSKDVDYSAKTKSYTFKLSADDEEVENYVKTYLDTIYTNATSNTFDAVAKYFDSSSNMYSSIKTNYESLVKKATPSEGSSYVSDFQINDLEFKGVYYYDDNNIVAIFDYQLSYKMNYSTTSYDRKSSIKTVLVLKKDSKEKYVITNGYNIFVKG